MSKFIVYKAKNSITKKCYIGITGQSLEYRINQHKYRSSRIENLPFYNAINKYGFDSFKFTIIVKCKTRESAKNKEKFFIKKLKTKAPNGYNATLGGDGVWGNYSEGLKVKRSDGKIYKSLAEAARDIDCDYHSILAVLKGDSLQVKGYSFVDLEGKYDKIRQKRRKAVEKFKKDKIKKRMKNKKDKEQRRKKLMQRKTSKYIGVSYRGENRKKPWLAISYKNNKSNILGYFKTEKEAAKVYRKFKNGE